MSAKRNSGKKNTCKCCDKCTGKPGCTCGCPNCKYEEHHKDEKKDEKKN